MTNNAPSVAMMGFADIHTHLLHDVDDGPAYLSEALAIVRIARDNGTRTIVFTPHYRGKFRKVNTVWIEERFNEIKEEAAKIMPDMKLYLGSEVRYEMDAGKKLLSGRVKTINGTSYALIEFGTTSLKNEIIAGTAEIFRNGFIPIIAHIERYDVCRNDDALVNELLTMGALIQINADSVMGKNGHAIKKYCHRLLEAGCVHFVASDAHDKTSRPPHLRDCFLYIHKKYGAEYASQLFYHNAKAMLDNQNI